MLVDKLIKKIPMILSILLTIVYGIIAANSFIRTARIDIYKNSFAEYVYYTFDQPLLMAIAIAVILAALYGINKRGWLNRIDTDKLRNIWTIYYLAMGTLWVLSSRSVPVYDSKFVSDCAVSFSQGDYSALFNGQYLDIWKHQIGIVFLLESFYSIVGYGNVIAVMLANVVCITVTGNMLFQILALFNEDKKVHNLYYLLMFFCIQPLFYCDFVYGTLFGLCFAVMGVYLVLRYLKDGGSGRIILACGSMGVAILAKENFLIYLLALVLLLLYQAMSRRQVKCVIAAAVMALAVFAPKPVEAYYAAKAGDELSEGMPASAHVAMGLMEGPCADGWSNMYNTRVFDENYPDREKMNQAAMEKIQERLQIMLDDPVYGLEFFYHKFASQWAEPTFQSLWLSSYQQKHSGELSRVVQSIYQGKLNTVILEFCNVFTTLLWGFSAFYYWRQRKRVGIGELACGIIVLGGFVFHMLWEAKALYILPYYMLSFPAAAAGVSQFLGSMEQKLRRKNAA